MRVHGVVVPFEAVPPDDVEELPAIEGTPRVAGEVDQQVELLCCQLDGVPVQGYRAFS